MDGNPLKTSTVQVKRQKRGANAIEFALTLPVFLVVFFGAMDWGWYFFMRAQVMNATVIGCEIGSRVHPDSPKSPAKLASDELDSRYQTLGWKCSSLGSFCDYEIETTERAGDTTFGEHKTLFCKSRLPYTPLTGYVAVPETISVQSEMRMEFQK